MNAYIANYKNEENCIEKKEKHVISKKYCNYITLKARFSLSLKLIDIGLFSAYQRDICFRIQMAMGLREGT